MKKRITYILLFLLVSVLLSGCGLFKSDEQEFTEIVTDFLDAANQNATKKMCLRRFMNKYLNVNKRLESLE